MKSALTRLLAVLMCIFSFAPAHGVEQNNLRINCTIHSPYEAFFFRLVEEICFRNNIAVTRNTPPVGRSLINVNDGIDDGDGPRIGGLSNTYPDLVRVKEPFGEFQFGAFASAENLKIDTWSSLRHVNVAYICGWKIFDNNVTEAKSITTVKDKRMLFGLLTAGRTDVVLITKLAGYAMIRQLELRGIRFLEPPLAVEPNYLYLNDRHASLAPKLSGALKDLKSDGTYDRLYQEMIMPYLPE